MESNMETNRRLSGRQQTLGLMSSVFDGRSAVLGVVEDISPNGLRVSNIPASFEDKVDTCFSVVNGPRRDMHLALHPRWVRSTNRGMYKMIGFEIHDPSTEWTHFVESVTGETDRLSAMVAAN